MLKSVKTLLIWTLILCACSSGITSPQTFPASNATNTPASLELPLDLTTKAPTGPKIIVTVGTPNIGQGPNGNFPESNSSSGTCIFTWTNTPLEKLTDTFDASIKQLNSEASAHATAFGEDCVYEDGRKVFLAIETDFYVNLPVTNLIDFKSFGDWIAQTMPIITSLPPEMIEGQQMGFVEYGFVKNESESLFVRVPIQVYRDSAQGKTGEELFRLFHTE